MPGKGKSEGDVKMSILDELWIKWTSKFIAEDRFGNKYYESNQTNYLGQKERYVIYGNSAKDPSSIPPIFHGWLHYITNEIPVNSKDFAWQQEHCQNLTGTKFAYNPLNQSTKRVNVSADYQPFQPN